METVLRPCLIGALGFALAVDEPELELELDEPPLEEDDSSSLVEPQAAKTSAASSSVSAAMGTRNTRDIPGLVMQVPPVGGVRAAGVPLPRGGRCSARGRRRRAASRVRSGPSTTRSARSG